MPILDRLRGVANTAPPLLIVALYAVVSALWILFSDRLLARLVWNPEQLTIEQTLKGWFFVLATSVMLYGLISRHARSVRRVALALRRKDEELLRQSLHDQLTGLPNRSALLRLLEHRLAACRKGGPCACGLALIDLERFGVINDSLGHAVSDQFIQAAVRRVMNGLAPTDGLYRVSGDHLAIVSESRPARELVRFATSMTRALAKPLQVNSLRLNTTISAGLVMCSPDHGPAEHVLRDAYAAMRRARKRGRGNVELFDPRLRDAALRSLDLEMGMLRGLERGEFLLFYQPIVSLESGRTAGLEALIRWRRASGEMVSPGEFIPLAEDSGLIIELGTLALREACLSLGRFLEALDGDREFFLSVNVSGWQIMQPGFENVVEGILRETGAPASAIKLEITESAAMANPPAAKAIFSNLKAKGLSLAIDDFGTGYSSLAYLPLFPIDTLKIDQSFVRDLPRSRPKLHIVEAIASLSRDLGLKIVAEGVENEEQQNALMDVGCQYGQGYKFSPPAPAEEILRQLAAVRATRLFSANR